MCSEDLATEALAAEWVDLYEERGSNNNLSLFLFSPPGQFFTRTFFLNKTIFSPGHFLTQTIFHKGTFLTQTLFPTQTLFLWRHFFTQRLSLTQTLFHLDTFFMQTLFRSDSDDAEGWKSHSNESVTYEGYRVALEMCCDVSHTRCKVDLLNISFSFEPYVLVGECLDRLRSHKFCRYVLVEGHWCLWDMGTQITWGDGMFLVFLGVSKKIPDFSSNVVFIRPMWDSMSYFVKSVRHK